MYRLKLEYYMNLRGFKVASMATEIGRTRQNVEQWVNKESTIELTDVGYKVRLPNGLIVHETQVAK